MDLRDRKSIREGGVFSDLAETPTVINSPECFHLNRWKKIASAVAHQDALDILLILSLGIFIIQKIQNILILSCEPVPLDNPFLT